MIVADSTEHFLILALIILGIVAVVVWLVRK